MYERLFSYFVIYFNIFFVSNFYGYKLFSSWEKICIYISVILKYKYWILKVISSWLKTKVFISDKKIK